jgi:membrane fusion protein (multidrug efflux system)
MALYRQRVNEKGYNPEEESGARAEIPLFLGLSNEEGYPHEGIADFAESGLDTGTGTLQLRGIFQNPGKSPVLVPGLFARLRMPIDKRDNALLVTDRAIGADQGGNYLLAVTSDNTVEKRPIRMGQLVDGLSVIEEGLQPGESVIVRGVQRARPGVKVDPEQIDMKTLTASAIKAAAKAKMDQAKTAAASPAGDDSKSAGKEEKKE